jgi:hypothetical protein
MRFPYSFRGLNGKRSLNNPRSRAARILRYVRLHPGSTKREILAALSMGQRLHMDGSRYVSSLRLPVPASRFKPRTFQIDMLTAPSSMVRGQHAYVFRLLILLDKMHTRRQHGTVTYHAN